MNQKLQRQFRREILNQEIPFESYVTRKNAKLDSICVDPSNNKKQ